MIDYDQILKFKQNFLKTLRFEWLVCGHLLEENAIEICDIALKNIDHQILEKDDLLTFK